MIKIAWWGRLSGIKAVAHVLGTALMLASVSSNAAIVIIDDAKQRIELALPAKRVVALAPFLTELVFAADAGKFLVGVSAYSDYPLDAKQIQIVADYQGVAMESLLAVKPDLVLAWQTGNRPQDIARIKALGIPVAQFELKTLADIPRAMAQIALFTGVSEQPQALTDFNSRLDALTKKYSAVTNSNAQIRYFLPIERMPLMTLSGNHIVSRALALCGGENIFASATALVPVVNKEAIVAANPEVIFVSNAMAGRDAFRVKTAGEGIDTLPTIANKKEQIYGLNADWLMRPTPRMLGAVESACAAMDAVRTTRALMGK